MSSTIEVETEALEEDTPEIDDLDDSDSDCPTDIKYLKTHVTYPTFITAVRRALPTGTNITVDNYLKSGRKYTDHVLFEKVWAACDTSSRKEIMKNIKDTNFKCLKFSDQTKDVMIQIGFPERLINVESSGIKSENLENMHETCFLATESWYNQEVNRIIAEQTNKNQEDLEDACNSRKMRKIIRYPPAETVLPILKVLHDIISYMCNCKPKHNDFSDSHYRNAMHKCGYRCNACHRRFEDCGKPEDDHRIENQHTTSHAINRCAFESLSYYTIDVTSLCASPQNSENLNLLCPN